MGHGGGPTRCRDINPRLTTPEFERLFSGTHVFPRVELDCSHRTEAKRVAPDAGSFSLCAVLALLTVADLHTWILQYGI
jgi:hypothetical protein